MKSHSDLLIILLFFIGLGILIKYRDNRIKRDRIQEVEELLNPSRGVI